MAAEGTEKRHLLPGTAPLAELTAQLHERRAAARLGGGEDRVAKQHSRGKMDVRQRIDALFDAGTFTEVGPPRQQQRRAAGRGRRQRPGRRRHHRLRRDRRPHGLLRRLRLHGARRLHRAIGERKVSPAAQIWPCASACRWCGSSTRWRAPRRHGRLLRQGARTFADTGYLFREQVVMSGVVPQVAAMVGPGAAGTAYIPGLADFVPMVKGNSSIAIGGPYLVKSTCGEDITEEALGGSKIHNEISGVADLEVRGRQNLHRRHPRVPLVLPLQLRRQAAPRRRIPRPPRRGTARRGAGRRAQGLRHAQGHPAHRRRREVLRDEAEVGEEHVHRLSRASTATRSASSRTTRSTSAASST